MGTDGFAELFLVPPAHPTLCPYMYPDRVAVTVTGVVMWSIGGCGDGEGQNTRPRAVTRE